MAAIPSEVRITIKLVEWTAPIEGWRLEGFGETVTAVWTAPYELRKMVVVYTRQPTGGPPQDIAETTHHFINLTGGTPDATWTTADYSQVESAFSAFWSAIRADYSPMVATKEYRWYAAGPAYKSFGPTSAPLLRVTSAVSAGTSSARSLPPQCAVSVTEWTTAHYTVPPEHGHPGQLRNRWGRFYLPNPCISFMGNLGAASEGRIDPTRQNVWATAAGAFYNACRGGNNLVPVVYSSKNGNSYSVDRIHLDDIVDVIRRRRFETPLSRQEIVLDPVTGG
jgi:hypothetical protein